MWRRRKRNRSEDQDIIGLSEKYNNPEELLELSSMPIDQILDEVNKYLERAQKYVLSNLRESELEILANLVAAAEIASELEKRIRSFSKQRLEYVKVVLEDIYKPARITSVSYNRKSKCLTYSYLIELENKSYIGTTTICEE